MNLLQSASPRILLVEDDSVLAAFLVRALRRAGHTVETLTRGDHALRVALAHGCDLLVLDWQLPGLDGLAVVRALRLAGNPLPVLILSGKGDFRRDEALAAGADDFLSKPCGLDELTQAVAALATRIPGTSTARAA